jgi:hypothetical protein
LEDIIGAHYSASLIHYFEAPCLENVRDRGHGHCPKTDANHQCKAKGQCETLIAAHTALQVDQIGMHAALSTRIDDSTTL